MNYLVTAYKKKYRPNGSSAFIEDFDDIDKAIDKKEELTKDSNYLKVRLSKIIYEKVDI